MACQKTEEITRRFRAALSGTSHWRIAEGRLEFFDATGKPLAVFERREATSSGDAAATLQGTTWQLVTFQGGDDRTLTPDDPARYTIEFAAGGSLVARIDCNRGRGTWKATPSGQLEFGPLALTRAKCPDGSLHDHIVKQWPGRALIRDQRRPLVLVADGRWRHLRARARGTRALSLRPRLAESRITATSGTANGTVYHGMMPGLPPGAPGVRLGLQENLGQFSLLVVVNAFVGAMVGIERSILPLLAEQEFHLAARAAILSFIVVFGVTKAVTNYLAGRSPIASAGDGFSLQDGSSPCRCRSF